MNKNLGIRQLNNHKRANPFVFYLAYHNSFNVSATIFFYFSLFGDFQSDLSGCGYPLDDATPTFISDSGSPNIELPESEIKVVVASSRGLPYPVKSDWKSPKRLK